MRPVASVIGGGFAVFAYFVGALAAPHSLAVRLGLALLPLVWIGSKEMLRLHYYQRFGRVGQVQTAAERRWHLGFTIATAVLSAGIVAVILFGLATRGRTLANHPGVLGYLAYVGVMPLLVWYFMRTPLEFVVGVFLVAQAALMFVGEHYSLWEQVQAPIAGVVLMAIGVKQHLDFRALERDLARLGA
ncbi:MAG: hypothetical protein WEB88_06180 [Gemmatimonadota bacterium]